LAHRQGVHNGDDSSSAHNVSNVSSANDLSSVSHEGNTTSANSFSVLTPTSASSVGGAGTMSGTAGSVTFGVTTTNTPLSPSSLNDPLHSGMNQGLNYDHVTPQHLLKYLKDYLMKNGAGEKNQQSTNNVNDSRANSDASHHHDTTSPSTPRSVASANTTSSIREEIDREMNTNYSGATEDSKQPAAPVLTSHENSLQYSRLVWLYQQLLHEYNEFQRFHLLHQHQQIAPASPGDSPSTNDIISKHEQKLKREAKLLQQRLHEQSNVNQYLSADLKKFKKKLNSLQDKWMNERNEKLDLEMERDEQLGAIKSLEKGFERIVHMLASPTLEDEKRTISTSSTQLHEHHQHGQLIGATGRVPLAVGVGSHDNPTSRGAHNHLSQKQRTSRDYELPHQKQYIEQHHGGADPECHNPSITDMQTSPITPLSAAGGVAGGDQNSSHSSHTTTDTITLPHSMSQPNFASDSQSEEDDVSSTSSESIFSLTRHSSNGNVRKSSKQERLFCPPTKQLMTCVQIFNKQSPKAAINSLIRCGFIKDDPKAIAIFLVRCGSLDLKRLGEYLGDEKNINILHHYAHYQMERLLGRFPFDVALKAFVQSLSLPKEGQQVTRITEAFSDAYVELTKLQHHQELDQRHTSNRSSRKSESADVKDADNAFLLACSILMLNVDLHSGKTNRPPMSRDQFVALFNNDEIPHSYLKKIYDNIQKNEWKDESMNAGDDTEDLYPPEVEQESAILPMVKSVGNFQASDDHQLKTSLSLSSLVDSPTSSAPPVQSRDRSMTKPSPVTTRVGRLRTRSVHQRQKSKSFDMHVHSRQDIPLYFSLREFSKRSIHTFQIRDTISVEWSNQPLSDTRSAANPLTFSQETEKQIHKGDFFLCLYNTRNRSSFAAIEHIVNFIVKARPKEAKSAILDQIMIVAIDFNDDTSKESKAARREISTEEGQRLALEVGAPFMSVCILKDQEVKQVFRTAVHYCLRPVSRHMNSLNRQMGLGAGNVSEQIHEHHDDNSSNSSNGGGHNSKKLSSSPGDTYLSFEVNKERHEFENAIVDTIFYVQ